MVGAAGSMVRGVYSGEHATIYEQMKLLGTLPRAN